MLLFVLACSEPCTAEKPCPTGEDTAGDTADSGGDSDSHSGGETGAETGADTGDSGTAASAGCGVASELRPGGVQVTFDAGAAGGGERGYWLSLPRGYDPTHAYPVVFGFPGTDWLGEQIQPYLDLEDKPTEAMIYVYPDPLWRSFDGWGTYGGWLLGPYAAPADGMEDLVYTGAILDALEAELCVDTSRVYVTGHSWGGDMAAVVACFLGDRFRAAAPAAANEPYWFETRDTSFACTGNTAVWTWFGVADDHFTWQDYPGQFGDEQDAFWSDTHGCTGTDMLDVSGGGTCVEHSGCTADTRYCLYPPATEHQIPAVFAAEVMGWFEAER